MVEKFNGKWVPDVSSLKGAVEYLATVSAPPSQLDDIMNTKLVEIFLDGNIFQITTHIVGKQPKTDTMKLGEDIITEGPGGITMLSNTRLEKDRLTTLMSVLGVELTVIRRIQDGVLFSEFSTRGKTMTFSLKRA